MPKLSVPSPSSGQASGFEAAWHGSITHTNSHTNASRRCEFIAAVRMEERTTSFSPQHHAPIRQKLTSFASEARGSNPFMTACGERNQDYQSSTSLLLTLSSTAPN